MGSFSKTATASNFALRTATAWGGSVGFMGSATVIRLTLPTAGTLGREITSCKVILKGTKQNTGVSGTITARITNDVNLLPNQHGSAVLAGSANKTWWGLDAMHPGGENELPLTQNLATLSGYGSAWYLLLLADTATNFEFDPLATRVEGVYRDTTMRGIIAGVERMAEPYCKIDGVYRRSDAHGKINGVFRLGS